MKDQRVLLKRCMQKEIPVMVLSGNDALAVDVVRFYLALAKKRGCSVEFIEDFEKVVRHYESHVLESPDTIKLPD